MAALLAVDPGALPVYTDDWFDERLVTLEDESSTISETTDAYLILVRAIRDSSYTTIPELVTQRAERFLKAAVRHILSAPNETITRICDNGPSQPSKPHRAVHPKLSLAQSALRFTGFLISNSKTTEKISTRERNSVNSALISNLKGCAYRDKATINLTIWCLTTQVFEDEFSNSAADVIDGLDAVRAANFQSRSIEHETMRCYLRLLQSAAAQMHAKSLNWALEALRCLVSDAIGVRKVAMQVLERGKSSIEDALREEGIDFPTFLADNDIIPSLLRNNKSGIENSEEFACKSCGIIVAFLGHNLKSRTGDNEFRKLLTDIASVFSKLFSDKKSAHVLFALNAWSFFIRALCQGRVTDKIIKFLLKPLTEKRFAQQWIVNSSLQRRRLEIWHLLVQQLGDEEIRTHYDLVIQPVLDICFPRLDSGPNNTISVKITSGVEDVSFSILGTVLRCAPDHSSSVDQLADNMPLFCAYVVASFKRKLHDRLLTLPTDVFSQMCDRFLRNVLSSPSRGKGISQSQAKVFTQLLSVALQSQLETNGSTTLAMLYSILKNTDPCMLTAPSCKVIANSGTRSAMDVISETLFSEHCVHLHDQGTEFNSVFQGLMVGASVSKNGLHHLSTLLYHLGNMYKRDNQRTMEALKLFTCWTDLCKSFIQFVKKPESNAYEGSDFSPDFSAVVDALMFPFENSKSVKFWNVSGFTDVWNTLLSAFCQESEVVNVNAGHPHLCALTTRLLDLGLEDSIVKEPAEEQQHVFRVLSDAVSSILKGLKFNRTATRQSFAAGDVMDLHTDVASRLLKIGNSLKPSIPPASKSYVNLISALTVLLNCKNISVSPECITNRLLMPSVDLLKSSCADTQNKSTRALQRVTFSYWESLAKTIEAVADMDNTYFDSDALTTYASLFIVILQHPRAEFVAMGRDMWNATFGTAVWLDYPSDLAAVLKGTNKQASKSQSLHLPGWVGSKETHASTEPPRGSASTSEQDTRAATKRGRPKRKQTFILTTKKRGSAGRSRGPSTRASKRKLNSGDSKGLDSMASTDFVDIPPSPAKKLVLTEHQKEIRAEQRKRRRELPISIVSEASEALSPPIGDAEDDMEQGLSSSSVELQMNTQSSEKSKERHQRLLSSTPETALKSSPEFSILKHQDNARSVERSSKKRRVSFDLASNTNYVVARDTPINTTRKADYLFHRGSTMVKGNGKESKVMIALLASPPPTGLSPMVTKPDRTQLSRNKIEDRFVGSPVRTKARRAMSMIGVDSALATPASAEIGTHRSGVQRSLEPAFVYREPEDEAATGDVGLPRAGGVVFSGLSTCKQPVAQVLPFFHTTVRRGVSQLLAARKVRSVGELCSLSGEKFSALPLRMTKSTRNDLQSYMASLAAKKAIAPSPLSQIGRRARLSSPSSPPQKSEDFIPAKPTLVTATVTNESEARLSDAVSKTGEGKDDSDSGGNGLVDTLRNLAQQSPSKMKSLTPSEIMGIQKHLTKLMTATNSVLPSNQ